MTNPETTTEDIKDELELANEGGCGCSGCGCSWLSRTGTAPLTAPPAFA